MRPIYRKLAIAGGAVLLWAAATGTGHAATDQATTTATVVLPITITNVIDMNFGKFMSGGTGGTVVVSTANVQSVTGGVTTTATLGATAAAATFNIAGEPNSTYAITYPAQTDLTGPGTAMAIGTFTTAVSSGVVGTFPVGGSQVLSVGATLTVGANQTSGTYNGTLDVAVNYN